MFLGQGLVWQQVWRHLETLGQRNSSGLPSSIATTPPGSLQENTSRLRDSLIAIGGGDKSEPAAGVFGPTRSTKRRRVDHEADGAKVAHSAGDEEGTTNSHKESQNFPPDCIVDSLVEIYFERIHPWIPMLHVRKFRQQLADPLRRPELSTILHAITSVCARFSDDPSLGNPASRDDIVRKSRETVILRSMESFSVKNLQALIICAFDTVSLDTCHR